MPWWLVCLPIPRVSARHLAPRAAFWQELGQHMRLFLAFTHLARLVSGAATHNLPVALYQAKASIAVANGQGKVASLAKTFFYG